MKNVGGVATMDKVTIDDIFKVYEEITKTRNWEPLVPIYIIEADIKRNMPKCECGSASCGSSVHSYWCPLYDK